MSALASSATLTPFNRFFKLPGRLAPICLRGNAVNSWLFANSGWKGICFASSSTDGISGGTAERLEGEDTSQSYSWPNNKKPRICILGGGFGGLYTALRLESLTWPDDKKPQVLLIDQSKHFVFKPMLYELLSGEPWEIAPPFSDLLSNTSIRFYQDRVKLLRPSSGISDNGSEKSTCAGTVHLESGLLVEYDWLVLAFGAKPNLDLVPGAVQFALPFATLEDACKVDYKLKDLERKNFGKEAPIRVVVVGCGYSGVELAATVSERLKDKGMVQAINVENTICPSALPGNREAALKVLSDRNVKLLLGYLVQSIIKASEHDDLSQQPSGDQDFENHDHGKLILDLQPTERGLQGQTLEADLVLWTVGNKPQLPESEPCDKPHPLPLNSRGQIEVDDTLCVKGHPHIFAVGDSAAFRDSSGRLLPATAQVAYQQADFAGWNLWAAINERPLLPFRFQNLGEMMTLGRFDAAVTPSFVDGLTLEGPIGHAARKFAYLIRLPTDEHRLKVGVSWFTKTAVDSVAILQTTLTKVLSG